MKRALSFFIIMTFFFTAAACSAVKPPDPSAVKSKNALSALKDLTQAYEAKRLDSFLSKVADEYQERETFSRSLADVFAKYNTIHFNLQYTRMLITIQDRGHIKVSCNWDAEWVAPAGTSQKGGGRATFSFDQTSFKLVSINGKNPFIPTESTMKQ